MQTSSPNFFPRGNAGGFHDDEAFVLMQPVLEDKE
jgi:hypothetical protein